MLYFPFLLAIGVPRFVIGLVETATMTAAESAPPAKPHTDYSVVYLQILIAILGSIIFPLIYFLLNRSRAAADKLRDKNDSSAEKLRSAEQERIVSDLKEIKENQRKYIDKFEELQRAYDRHPLDCQNKFVTAEAFRRESAASKEYVKLLYGAIKQHLAKLESDLDSSDDNLG